MLCISNNREGEVTSGSEDVKRSSHPRPKPLYNIKLHISSRYSEPVILFSMILHQGREWIRFPGK